MSIAEKITKIAENEKKVYDAGKKSEYDAFWDSYQDNGKRTDYSLAFGGAGWNEEIFKPKYAIAPTNAYMMFYQNKSIKDLSAVSIDTSKCTNFQYTFSAPALTKIGVVDTTSANGLFQTFYNSTSLVEIEKIILKPSTSSAKQTLSQVFNLCSSLEKVEFEGEIKTNGFNVQWSTKLNKSSIISIINALSDTTSGLSVTLSKTAVNNAFGIDVDDQTTYPEGSEYYTLRHSKDNWTVNYI